LICHGFLSKVWDVRFRKNKHRHERFYLLPGQGGKNYYRKQRVFRFWAILVAVVFGTLMGVVMWCLSRPKL